MADEDLGRQVGDRLADAAGHWLAGDTAAALRILEEAESSARSAKYPGLVFVLIQKAGWLRELGSISEAQAALKEADSISQGMPPGQAPFPSLRMEQGIVARRAGDLAKAEALLGEARAMASGSPIEIVVMSDILANLAAVYGDQGRIEEARKALTDAMGYDLKTGDQRALANNLNMLGLLYLDAGDRGTARVYLEQSNAVATSAGLAKEMADASQNLAIVADQEGRLTDAGAGFSAALSAAARAGREEDIASAKNSLGVLALRAGNFLEAKQLLTEAHDVHSRLGLGEFAAIDLMNLAQVELSLDDPGAACTAAKAALEIAERRGDQEILWAAHYVTAHAQCALIQGGEVPEDELKTALEEALANYDKAADAIDIVRAGIGRSAERERLLVGKESIYDEAMMVAALLRRMTVAWTFAERSRARAFLDSLGGARIDHQAAKGPLSARRSQLTKQLLGMGDASGPDGKALLDELHFLRSRIIAEQPATAAVTEGALPSIEGVASAIAADTAIVEFVVSPGNRLTAFVLTHRGVEAMHTADLGGETLRSRIEQFRAELQQEVPGEPAGEALFLTLFSQIWDVLDRFDRLLIVPHRELHYLPFAALWFRSSGKRPKHLYLSQRFNMSSLASASHLLSGLNMPRPELHERNALVVGNPTQDLPGSETEAVAVARVLKAEPLLGAEAVRDRVLLSSEHSVIHIASHGVYDETDPLLSGVVLADGRLSVEDLLETRLNAGLLTLSGCVTGLAMPGVGDELIGLSRAALAAGVPSVITTLWNVRDDSAGVFFESFYGYLAAGSDKASALGDAQRTMLGHREYSNPVHWAPYVLLGDGR